MQVLHSYGGDGVENPSKGGDVQDLPPEEEVCEVAEGDAPDVPGEHGEGVEQPVGLDVHAEHVLEVGGPVGEEDVEEEGVGAVRDDGRPEG